MCPCTASLNTRLHHPSAETGEDPPEGLAAPSVVHRPAASARTSLRAPRQRPRIVSHWLRVGATGQPSQQGLWEPVEGTRVERSVSPTDDGLRKGRITTQRSPDIPGLAYDTMPSLTHSFIHSFLMALPSHHLPCLPSLLLTQSPSWGIKKREIFVTFNISLHDCHHRLRDHAVTWFFPPRPAGKGEESAWGQPQGPCCTAPREEDRPVPPTPQPLHHHTHRPWAAAVQSRRAMPHADLSSCPLQARTGHQKTHRSCAWLGVWC